MTSPQQIIQVPGVGAEVAQAVAPLIQILQARQAQEIQLHQQKQALAAHLFGEGMKTDGFELTDTANLLAQQLGVPGLPKSIATARVAEKKRKQAEFSNYLDSVPGLDPTNRVALQIWQGAKEAGAPVEMQNTIYQSFAGPQGLTLLERARLDQINTEVKRLNLDINATPTSDDQVKAASILGIKPEDLIKDPESGTVRFPYVEVLASIMKARATAGDGESDMRKAIVNAALRVMTDLRDPYGHPTQTPDQALDITLQTFKNFFPNETASFQRDPETLQALEAAKRIRISWQNAKDANYVQRDPDTKKVTKQWPNRAAYRTDLEADMKLAFPMLTDNRIRTIMEIVETSVFSPRIP